MEVHHHPEVEKKGLKEYIFEGLMIFFAVTMGFYAENIRENITDSSRGKEYMHSMLEDLKQDTSNIALTIRENRDILNGLDTLISYISKPLNNANDIALTYAYDIKYRYYTPEVSFSERTMSQLKNNGGLRLIKEQKISDALSTYDQGIRTCDRQRDMVISLYHAMEESEKDIFDFGPLNSLLDDLLKKNVFNVSIKAMLPAIKGKVYMKTKDRNKLSKFVDGVLYEETAVGLYDNGELAGQKEQAVSLISMIKKKYNFKDE